MTATNTTPQSAAQQIIVHEWPSSAFFEVVGPVELVYNQK